MLRNTKKILTFALLTSKSEELVEITAYENIDVQELLLQSIKYFEEQYFPTWDKVKVFTEQVGKFYCNEEYFKLIIDELLDNMIKFHTGESFPTIVLKPIDKGFSLSFINEVDKPTSLSSTEIQPFNKFHNDMSKSGLGIGLYVTKRLCQLMKLQLKTEQENGIINIELSTY
jgi:signal transduction histidine kinase